MRLIHLAAIAVAAVMLTGCGDATGGGADAGTDPASDTPSEPSSPTSATGIDGAWKLVRGTTADGPLPLVDRFPITLDLDGEAISGTSACNHYGGTFTHDSGSIAIGDVFGTEMACADEVMVLETAYLAALQVVDTVARDGATMTFTGPGVELTFDEVPAVPDAEVTGTTWVLESLVSGDAVSSTLGEPATLVLGDDRTLAGSTGCREFTGTYSEAGDAVATTGVTPTGTCTPDVAAQDAHVIGVLAAAEATVEGDLLTLTAADGTGLQYRATP